MLTFDIIKKNDIDKTFRVSKLIADFDLKPEHSNEHFVGAIDVPSEWKIGLICGSSGTGKTTIGKHLFGDIFVTGFDYNSKSVVDDMPKSVSTSEIEKAFSSVGFSSVPSWLKPYSVLSNGEKMRCDLARAFLSMDMIAFDEFTSVVDRKVAESLCIATRKFLSSNNKKFIAISCHKDIIEWLQPDWCFDTDRMKTFFHSSRTRTFSQSGSAAHVNGKSLGSIIISTQA